MVNKRLIVLSALAAMAAGGCGGKDVPPVPVAKPDYFGQFISTDESSGPPADYLDILEAVFRRDIERYASQYDRRVDCYFLFLHHKDPPPELLARFASSNPPVLPVSECIQTQDNFLISKDDPSKNGMRFVAASIKWNSNDSVELCGGMYENGVNHQGNSYIVERKDGKWKTTDAE